MRLEINPRGNGACPLCSAEADCRIKRAFEDAVEGVNGTGAGEMDIVVYACPYFKERA
jgi:hypothetical protein